MPAAARNERGAPISGVALASRHAGRLLTGATIPLGIVILWCLMAWSGIFGPLIPSPKDVVEVTAKWMIGDQTELGAPYYSGTWLRDAVGSLERAIIGFAIGAISAVLLGVWVGWSDAARRAIDPTIHLLRSVPRVALLPFAIIFLGLGAAPALALVAIGTFAQTYVQVVQGVQLVPRDLKRAAFMLGSSRMQVLRRVVIPYATPSILSGLRLGIVYAWTMLVLAEMFAVGSGFGYTLWKSYEFLQVDLLISSVVMISIAGWLSDRLLVLAMRRQVRWATAISGSNA